MQRHAELVRVAESRGGKLLSPKYLGSRTKHQWQCRFGHKWGAVASTVKSRGTWCPECGKGLGERICRLFFEQAFEAPFPTRRPSWLVSPRGGRMELDGYNKDLAIAFEHQGMYHYERVKKHNRKYTLETRQAYDQHKREQCIANGVLLIEVPEVGSLTQPENIKPLVIEALESAGRTVPESLAQLDFDPSKAYTGVDYDTCVKMAEARGGKCLSTGFMGWDVAMEWQCAKGHTWKIKPSHIKHSNTWCGVCSNRVRLSVDHLHRMASKRGGKCLSKKYNTARSKYTWQCAKGHKWRASYTNVQQGGWCPECVVRPSFPELIDRYKKIALERGGVCLSDEYVNTKTRLNFRCKNGHEWMAFPDNVARGNWCHKCANKLRTGRPKGI